MQYHKERQDIIYWAKLLNQKGFVTARSGNISYRVERSSLLVTAHDSYLGHLEENDILLVDNYGNVVEGEGSPTSEKSLHLEIHRGIPEISVVLHAHSPYSTAFFYYYDKLDVFSFEAQFYLGDVPIVEQDTPTVTDITPIVNALSKSNIVVLKNHGVVAVGKNFKEACSLIELLEEQAKVNLLIQGKNVEVKPYSSPDQNPVGNSLSRPKPGDGHLVNNIKKYEMLSKEHRDNLKEIVNNNQEVQKLGQQYDLTCTLAVKNQDTQEAMRFKYERGKIVDVDNSEDAEFVIIGGTEILHKVFNREIDPFVAVTQGKVTTKGNFVQMSKWYPVMVKTFKLWEQAPVE